VFESEGTFQAKIVVMSLHPFFAQPVQLVVSVSAFVMGQYIFVCFLFAS